MVFTKLPKPDRPQRDGYGNYFPDTGCAAGGPSCLACPLPVCVEDIPVTLQANRGKAGQLAVRNVEIWRLWQAGLPTRAIAAQIGISENAVRSAVSRMNRMEANGAATLRREQRLLDGAGSGAL